MGGGLTGKYGDVSHAAGSERQAAFVLSWWAQCVDILDALPCGGYSRNCDLLSIVGVLSCLMVVRQFAGGLIDGCDFAGREVDPADGSRGDVDEG